MRSGQDVEKDVWGDDKMNSEYIRGVVRMLRRMCGVMIR